MSDDVRDFESQVIQRSHQVPVLVDFWAPWCGPCRTLGPVLERLAEQASGRWELAKVNTEDRQDLAAAYRIASIPAVKLFVNGAPVDEFVGALSEPEIRRFLDRALPSPHAALLVQARAFLAEGAARAAIKLLEPVVESAPGNTDARVLLAQALLTTHPERVESTLAPVGPDADAADRAQALRTLARLAQLPPHAATMPAAKVRDRYLAGAAAVRAADFATALEAFIEILERDKAYDNGGAKEACKAIFQLLGRQHPLADRYFRAFSSALHS